MGRATKDRNSEGVFGLEAFYWFESVFDFSDRNGFLDPNPFSFPKWHDEYGDATPSQQWVDKVQVGIAAGQGSAMSRPLKSDEVMR